MSVDFLISLQNLKIVGLRVTIQVHEKIWNLSTDKRLKLWGSRWV